jgi:hypothetical protein
MRTLILAGLLAAVACDSAGPSTGGFSITSIEFTGGAVPGFLLEWGSAEEGAVYRLYRSAEPDIASDPSKAVLAGTTLSTLWTDTLGLSWGTEYFYAVSAGQGLWSNEVSAEVPGSPYPPPCLLSLERTAFTDCLLSWTEAEGDFISYSLLRSEYPGTILYADTVFTTTSRDSTSFLDHLVYPHGNSFYSVCVTDSSGLSSFSNEAVFTPGGDVPWRVTRSITVHGLQARTYLVTQDGGRMTGSRSFSGYSLAGVFRTDDGLPLHDAALSPDFVTELEGGTLLASHLTGQGHRLSIFPPGFGEPLASIPFPPVQWAVPSDAGILLGCGSISHLVDPASLEILQSASFGFFRGVSSPDGQRLFLLNGSGVLAVDASDLSITGGIPGGYLDVQLGSDGQLRCISSQQLELYDPVTLSPGRSFVFPEPAATGAVAVLPPQCDLVYLPVLEDGELVIKVWDSVTGDSPGTVQLTGSGFEQLWDLVPSPQGEFLWCLGWETDGTQSLFRISAPSP